MARNNGTDRRQDIDDQMKPLAEVLMAATAAANEVQVQSFDKLPVDQLAAETGKMTSASFTQLFKKSADVIRKAAQEKVDDAKAAQEAAAKYTQSIVDDALTQQVNSNAYADELEEVGRVHANNLVNVANGVASLHTLIQAERAKTVNPVPTAH